MDLSQLTAKPTTVRCPQGTAFNDAEIAQLMSYIRKQWGNDATLVTEEMVGAAREKYAEQAGTFTEADLKAVAKDADLPGEPFGAATEGEEGT